MKKKVFSVMTAAALVFSLTACSTNAKTEEPETAAQSSASQTEAYYRNGLYCNKEKCWVNWGQSWSEGLKRWGDNLFGSFSGGR